MNPVTGIDRIGRAGLRAVVTARGILAFALITVGAAISHRRTAARVLPPMIRAEIHRAGSQLLPMAAFVALGLGIILIGQTIALLSRVGAQQYIGTVMVVAVIRELGPLVVALLVLARAGAAHVIELATSRALGEIESLESIGIDPVHYLVVPRVLGTALSVLALTIYFLLVALAGGWACAFLENIAVTPSEYVRQLATALRWQDFVVLGLKSSAYGAVIAAITCYHGLARPLHLEDVPAVTSRAVVHSVVACVLVDLAFISLHLLA
jgi:phospholipid/cholesterol/gamma-HCH transport system permease protein